MKTFRDLVLVTVVAILTQPVYAAISEVDISNAYYNGDFDALTSMRAELDESIASDALLAAYLDWRLGSIYFGMGKEKLADEVLGRAQDTLEALVEKTPDSAEAWALLSSTLGMRIGIRPMTRGFVYGSRSDAAIERAMQLEPGNPRVLLIDAIALLNKPSLFGGNRDEALARLDSALEQIAANGTGRFSWGKADIYTWRGIAHQREGNAADAAQNFDEALVVVPSYRWAEQLRASVRID